ncbi:MAG TPA: hypothetical protein VF275_00155 [Gammaproteobacteria bacterium]
MRGTEKGTNAASIPAARECPPLAFDHVSFADGGRPVFEALSFSLDAGELACFTGSRCAGVKAFLRLASGNSRPASGEVRICGLPAECWSPAELAQHARLVVPSARLFIGCTVSEMLEAHIEPESANTNNGKSLARLALAQTGIAGAGNYYWSQLAPVERQSVQLSLLLARLWSLPESVRLVIVDDYLDAIPPQLAGLAFAALHDFTRQRKASVIATAHRVPLDEHPIDRVFLMHHDREFSCQAVNNEMPGQRVH